MSLDHARTVAQPEYDAIWPEASECGEVIWQYDGILIDCSPMTFVN